MSVIKEVIAPPVIVPQVEIVPPPPEQISIWRPSSVMGKINEIDAKRDMDIQALLSLKQTVEKSVVQLEAFNNDVQCMKRMCELLDKKPSQVNIRAGTSKLHTVPPYSSGTIYCRINEVQPVEVIVSNLLCNDDMCGLLAYPQAITEDHVLSVSVENLLDRPREVKVNFLYKTL